MVNLILHLSLLVFHICKKRSMLKVGNADFFMHYVTIKIYYIYIIYVFIEWMLSIHPYLHLVLGVWWLLDNYS